MGRDMTNSGNRIAIVTAMAGALLGVQVLQAPANAADLGGDCCADLEERIAELEQTTARKGNRKVSVAVSGWVNEAVFLWDDGVERNAYVGTNNLEQSRFRFVGEAKIDKDWSAGYTIEVGVWGHDSSRWNQDRISDPSSPSHDYATQLRKSNWWIKSRILGKATVGLEATATYHLLDDANFTNTRNFEDAEAPAVYQGVFLIRSNGQFVNGLRWNDVERGFNSGTPGQGGRRDIARYDSPEFAGFSVAAAWGEDDVGDVSLTYKREIHDFKLLGRIGYGESTDPASTGTACGGPTADFKCSWWGAAGTAMHMPTGLYVYGGYGQQNINSLPVGFDGTSSTWFIQPGIERKWHPLGKTTIYAEYRKDDAGANVSATGNPLTLGANLTFWSAGIVQNIEAADMYLYMMYRHAGGDFTDGSLAAPVFHSIDDFQQFITGALIKF